MERGRHGARWTVWVAALLVGAGAAFAEAPVGRFSRNANGEVTDSKTLLTWKVVPATAPSGAMECPPGGWALPMVYQLASLIDYRASGLAIDTDAFPEVRVFTADSNGYIAVWTNNRTSPGDYTQLLVNLQNGRVVPGLPTGYVFCVR
jgi:hypothetical protein